MKKIYRSLLIFIAIIILFLVGKGHTVLSREGIEVMDEVYSSDKKYKAISFLDTGNATVADNIRVALVDGDNKVAYDSDVIFLQNRSRTVEIEWDKDNNLLIKYVVDIDSDIIKEVKNLNNIKITYKKIGE